MSKAFRFGPALRELRIHLCQTGESSSGVRKFIQSDYVPIKQCNPGTPILIRECSGVQPRLWARYEMGKESSVSLSNMAPEEVTKQIQTLGCK